MQVCKKIHAETFASLSLNRQDFHISKVFLRKATFNGDFVCVCVCVPTCVCVRFVMSNSVTPWAVAHQDPLFMEFSRQGYWSGFLFLRVIIIE